MNNQQAPTPQPEKLTAAREVISPWQAVKRILSAVAYGATTTVELYADTVEIASNEILALNKSQAVRLDELDFERNTLIEERVAKRALTQD